VTLAVENTGRKTLEVGTPARSATCSATASPGTFVALDGQHGEVRRVAVADPLVLLLLRDERAGGTASEPFEPLDRQFPARLLGGQKRHCGVVGRHLDVRSRRSVDLSDAGLDRRQPAGLDLRQQQSGLDAADRLDPEVENDRAVVELLDLDREFVGEVDRLVDQLDGHPVETLHTARSGGPE